jgi:glycosyltransferase involved in cell wall biosynthesis
MGLIHDNFIQTGHEVDYFCSGDVPDRFQNRFARFAFPFLVRRHAVRAASQGRPYGVINVHEPSGMAVALLRYGVGGARVVVTSHGVEQRGWERTVEEGRLREDRPKLLSRIGYPATVLWQARLALQHADHVFCLNMEDRAYLVSKFRLPPERITRIYPAADHIYGEASAGRDYSYVSRLLFAGTWIKRKGTADLARAFSTLSVRHPQLRLVVLNGGVPESAVHACFPESLHPRVSCFQSRSEKETAAAFAEADLYVLPSLFEGTPLTLIEAMWSGLPIVTTATCGMLDVIEDGRNGLLVPIRSPEAIVNAVELLIKNRELRTRLGNAAHADASANYTWSQVAKPILRVYERITARIKPLGD